MFKVNNAPQRETAMNIPIETMSPTIGMSPNMPDIISAPIDMAKTMSITMNTNIFLRLNV